MEVFFTQHLKVGLEWKINLETKNQKHAFAMQEKEGLRVEKLTAPSYEGAR